MPSTLGDEMGNRAELLSHLVEASAMKTDIEHIKSNQAELTHRLLVSIGELSGDIKAMRTELQSVPDRIQACRLDMRREIEKDFPDRVDALEMEKRIEKQVEGTDRKLSEQLGNLNTVLNRRIDQVESKVDRVWIKITTAMTVVFVVAGLVAWILANVSGTVLKQNTPPVQPEAQVHTSQSI